MELFERVTCSSAGLLHGGAGGVHTRVPLGVAHDLLHQALQLTNDDALGLKAAQSAGLGDGGALDYAMHAAATVQEALTTCARYIRLLNGALSVRLEVEESRAVVLLDSTTQLPTVAEDFLMCVMYRTHLRHLLPAGSRLECMFVRQEPERLQMAAYQQAFDGHPLRFSMQQRGFSFDAAVLSAPLPQADSKLYRILELHLARDLLEMPEALSFAEQLRKFLWTEQPIQASTLPSAAAAFSMNSRTFARRLQEEGTTFGKVLDEVRLARAVRYLEEGRLCIEEIARVLGFSKGSAFHRAFRRWTGHPPSHYRPVPPTRGAAVSPIRTTTPVSELPELAVEARD